jgi:serine/threonine protein kinase
VDADPLPAHLAPGSIVAGRYRVLRQLGSGGIGIVLEAEQLGLGQRVALKLLRNELLDDPDTLARFEREARVVSQLSSENIVRIFGVERSEHGEPIMVLEFLFGHPVDALIDDPNPISISAAVDIVAEACAGLAVAHAAGVVHRDVKPGNLFLAVRADRSQVVKVLDFGLTTELGSKDARLTSTRRSFGTPLYMSPEQIMSAKDVDPRTDQHALALSLFELLTKRPAFWTPCRRRSR